MYRNFGQNHGCHGSDETNSYCWDHDHRHDPWGCGNLSCDIDYRPSCCDCNHGELVIYKIDINTNAPIPGVQFSLRNVCNQVIQAESDIHGLAHFYNLPPGCYSLEEIMAPTGYLPSTEQFAVMVDGCGNTTVNGSDACPFIIYNIPNPDFGSFTAIKVDVNTMAGLPGAVFRLESSSGQTLGAVSGMNGELTYTGLSPDTYMLSETTPPFGYLPSTETRTVVVDQQGNVTINGEPANGYFLPNFPA